jgi:hypothetical protein
MYNYHNSGYYQSSCLLFKNTTFRRQDSVSVFRWNLLSFGPIDRALYPRMRLVVRPTEVPLEDRDKI